MGDILDEGAGDVKEPVHDGHGAALTVSPVNGELGDDPGRPALGHLGDVLVVVDVKVIIVQQVEAGASLDLVSPAWTPAGRCLMPPDMKGKLRAVLLLDSLASSIISLNFWTIAGTVIVTSRWGVAALEEEIEPEEWRTRLLVDLAAERRTNTQHYEL